MRQCYRGHSYSYGNQTTGGVPQTLPPARLTAVTVLLRLYGNQPLADRWIRRPMDQEIQAIIF